MRASRPGGLGVDGKIECGMLRGSVARWYAMGVRWCYTSKGEEPKMATDAQRSYIFDLVGDGITEGPRRGGNLPGRGPTLKESNSV